MSKKEISPGAERRKYLNAVYLSGLAVIAFGIWDVIKLILGMITLSSDDARSIEGQTLDAARIDFRYVWIVVALIIVISLSLRFYVGRRAISEGKGAEKKPVYLAIAAIMTFFNFAGVVIEIIIAIQSGFSGIITKVVALIVDITSLSVLIVLLYSSIKLRMLSKNKEKEANG